MRLTPRGIGLLAAGGVLAVVAASAASIALAQVAALLVGLVLVALVWVLGSHRKALGMTLRRRVEPGRPTVAQVATVHLELGAGSLGVWTRLRERSPAALNRSRVRSSGTGRQGWSYQIRPRSRGYHQLGPSTVVHSDPLGLLRWPRQGEEGTPLLVWPRTARVEPIGSQELRGSEHSAFGLPERSLEDLTLREYVRGDDVHRVHWRSSARRGELMVRADEPTSPPALDLLLDLGRGPGAEWAVSAFASLAVGLIEDGLAVRLHVNRRPGPEAEPIVAQVTCTEAADALDVIATATPITQSVRADQRRGLHQAGPALIAVLHARDPGLLQTLAPLAARRRGYALFVTDRRDDHVPAAEMAQRGWSLHVASARGDTSGIASSWSSLLDAQVVH